MTYSIRNYACADDETEESEGRGKGWRETEGGEVEDAQAGLGGSFAVIRRSFRYLL